MITPRLEELVLCGDAVFRSITVGGSQKTVLPIPAGRYIVIVDITYFSRAPESKTLADYYTIAMTQLDIASERRQNSYVFRNNVAINSTGSITAPAGSTTIPVYLVHDSNVCFSFSDGQDITLSAPANTPATGTGVQYPFEYGKTGQRNPKAVSLSAEIPLPAPDLAGINFGGPGVPDPVGRRRIYSHLQFPPYQLTNNGGKQWSMPLAIINYVDVKGDLASTIAGNQ